MPYNGGIVTSDDRLREALDRTLAGLRVSLEEQVRALVRDVIDTAVDEQRCTTAAREMDELGRSSDADMAGLAEATHALDAAQSLGEVLNTLADSASHFVDRVAVFMVRSGRLSAWRVKAAAASLVQDAATRQVLTFPLTVGGRVVAILYVDSTHATHDGRSNRWPAMLDVLTCHASCVLESMTLHKALGLVPPRSETARPLNGSLR